jgi:hypothetical protein
MGRLLARLAGASVTHERALETRETSYMSRPARPFFIPKAHGPLRAAGHVAASEPFRAGRQGPKPWGT